MSSHNAFDYLLMRTEEDKNRYLAEIIEKSLKNERSELSAARKKGFKEGFELGKAVVSELFLRFGEECLEIMPLICQINECDRLRAIKNAIRTAKDISELKTIIGN